MMKAVYTVGFSYDEIQQLKKLVAGDKNLFERINGAYGMWVNDELPVFMSPPPPAYSKPLPDPSHVGKKIKVVKGQYAGRTGTVTAQWYNGDDCSGGYGRNYYALDGKDEYTNCFGIDIDDCELID